MVRTGEEQYLELAKKIITEGDAVYNTRTKKICKTIINADFEYETTNFKLPLITTRKSYWKQAVAEMIGYLRGYNSAEAFAELGCKTWFANANENQQWLENPNRRGEHDLGKYFSYSNGRFWGGGDIDQFKNIVDKLERNIDDRRLIMSFYNPGTDAYSCLPACMWNHTFSLVGHTLHLTSMQRSVDVPLGLNFNMVQCVFLLRIVAQITNKVPGKVFHKMVNCHVYEDQENLMLEQLGRVPYDEPVFGIDADLRSMRALEIADDIMEAFSVNGYKHHPAIDYPFSA